MATLKNPFVGLRAFEEDEDYLFFGRSAEIKDLLKKFSTTRFLAVIGSSGSGKSSLVKSGLLPAIYSGFLSVGHNWRVALIRPGDDAIGNLAKELATNGLIYNYEKSDSALYESLLEATLRRSGNGLINVYKQANLPATDNLLIVVDQFEELFRYHSNDKKKNKDVSDELSFVNLLLTAAKQTDSNVYVLITMRSDFLGDCSEFRGLPEAINEGQYLVPRMTREEIREAINGPVAVGGAKITVGLVTHLLNDIGNNIDQLPIFQHAMMRTWDYWEKKNTPTVPIDIDDYDSIGGMKSALSKHADEAFKELTEPQQLTCQLMFKALTDKSADVRGIRRPKSVADLCILADATSDEVIEVVNIFRKTGRTFLMPPPEVDLNNDSIIDISHESLMRVWERLVIWTTEEAKSGEVYLRLVSDAQRAAQIEKDRETYLQSLSAEQRAAQIKKDGGEKSVMAGPELRLTLDWFNANKPTAKWAEGYKGDFEQAITYLKKSEATAKAIKAKEEQDIADDKARDEADAKRIQDEKDAAANRKRKNMLYLMLFFAILFLGAMVGGYFVIQAKGEADKQRDLALEAQKRDSISNMKALAEKKIAEDATALAIKAQKSDSIQTVLANIAKNKALEQEAIANQKTKEAKEAERIAKLENDTARMQNIKIAANEYARLINDGPTLENKNLDLFYKKEYLLAYAHHFEVLKDSIADAEDKDAYNSLRYKLYFNNGLYQRINQNFKEIKLDTVVLKESSLNNDFYSKLLFDSVGVKDIIKLDTSNGKITLVKNGIDVKTAEPANAKTGRIFKAFTIDKKQQKVFCSTDDQLIYVYNNKLELVNTIKMVAVATALEYDSDKDILYFGTNDGHVGFIRYTIDSKDYPLFKKQFESKITTIQLFKRSYKGEEPKTYLLVTGKKSNPKVYALEGNYLRADNNLLGNELPYEQKLGEINNAVFYPVYDNNILLGTSKGTYLWNPYTDVLLDKLRAIKEIYPSDEIIKNTKVY